VPFVDPVPALKVEVAQIIVERLEGWTQFNAASLLCTVQPRVSNLRRGRLERFSLEQLVRYLARIGGSVALELTWDPRLRHLAAKSMLATRLD
jgi:predicted XRE-type DNA-binding protein